MTPRYSRYLRSALSSFTGRNRALDPYLLILPLVLVYVAILVAPFGQLLITSFREFIGAYSSGKLVGLENYADFLFGPGQLEIVRRTLILAVLTTVVCVILGYPAAYATARIRRPSVRAVVLVALLAPFMTSVVARTYGWRSMLGPGGIFEPVARAFGYERGFLFTLPGMTIGLVNVMLPFMIIPIYLALNNIDGRLPLAAASLGSPGWHVFARVYFPLSLSGIVSGVSLVMSLSLSSFVTPALVGGTNNQVVATEVVRIGTSYYNGPLSGAGAILLSLLALAFVFLSVLYAGKSAAARLGRI